jgi:hypothetical protein
MVKEQDPEAGVVDRLFGTIKKNVDRTTKIEYVKEAVEAVEVLICASGTEETIEQAERRESWNK